MPTGQSGQGQNGQNEILILIFAHYNNIYKYIFL